MFSRLGKRESKGSATTNAALLRRSLVEGDARNWRGATGRIQAKLTIGAVNDSLEAEADRVAAEVLERPDAEDGGRSPRHERGSQTGEGLPFGGRPLDAETRRFFEPRFGYDFSKVRIYPDERAADSARSMGALAYTMGANIAFDSGRYQPNTGEGRRLLAHELTHVVQQGQASAIPGGEGMKISAGRAAASIQRDTPAGRTDVNQVVGPLSVTKRFEDLASREEVKEALTTFLYDVQREQGGQTLHVTDTVRWAVRFLFQGNPERLPEGLLSKAAPGSVPEFADAVVKSLPEYIPRKYLQKLGTQSAKETPDTRPHSAADVAGHAVVDSTVGPIVKKLPISQSLKDKIMDGARGAVADGALSVLDQAMSGVGLNGGQQSAIHAAVEALIKQKAGTRPDRPQEGAGSPYGPAPVEPPGTTPSMGSASAPGEHIFKGPTIPFDIYGGKKLPKPNLPEAPAASAAPDVNKIIEGVDDASLIPAAAKGKANESNYGGAKEFARSVADALAAADKKKKFTVEVPISADYRHVEDLREIFDKMEAIVRQVAAALPGGAANVGEVIVSPARDPKDKTFPARRVIKLHGGD
jgi:uncharacterized protein DUF4157